MTQLATFIKFETHDYVIADGILEQQVAVLTEAYTRSITPLGSYKFDTTFGNEIPLLFNNRTIKITADMITTMQNNCLQPMLDSRRALSIVTSVPIITSNQVYITCQITDNNNNTYQLPLSYVTRS